MFWTKPLEGHGQIRGEQVRLRDPIPIGLWKLSVTPAAELSGNALTPD